MSSVPFVYKKATRRYSKNNDIHDTLRQVIYIFLMRVSIMSYTIVFVTNNYTPYTGGVVSSINVTIAQLQKYGHTVYIIAPSFLGKSHDDPEYVIRIPSLLRFMYKQNHMGVPWRAKHYINQILKRINPGVVHIHHPFVLGPVAVSCAKKMGIRTVFTYHTMYENYVHYVPMPPFVVTPVVKKLVLQFCRTVDRIIVPSSGIKEYLARHAITNTTLIPSGIQEFFLQQSLREKKLTKSYQLLYVGRFAKEKSIPFILDVMARLPDDFALTLVGYGSYTDALKEYAYETKKLSSERVRFVMKPDKQILLDLYTQAHLFLFPSHSDTQGLVLAESMACSTPVIAVDGVGQRDIIIQGKNGFIVQDQNEMCETILKIMSDEKLYQQLQHNAWQTAQTYDPKQIIKNVLAVYESKREQL